MHKQIWTKLYLFPDTLKQVKKKEMLLLPRHPQSRSIKNGATEQLHESKIGINLGFSTTSPLK